MERFTLILGNGALAVGLAAKLQGLGIPVGVLGKNGPQAFAATLITDLGSIALDLRCPTAEQISRAEAVFVAVKAYQLQQALHQHLPLISRGIPIIPLGNGAIESDLRKVAKDFPHLIFRLGVSTLAVTQDQTFQSHNKKGSITWGPIHGEKATAMETWFCEKGRGIFFWKENPLPTFRKKWLFNTTLNTLIAAKQLSTNGEALLHFQLLSDVFDEAYLLGEKTWNQWDQERNALFSELLDLIQTTKDNENSMAQDLRLNRLTESDYLAGLALQHEGFELLKELHQKITFSTIYRGGIPLESNLRR